MQDSQASCGVYSLHNALCALGVNRSAEELAALCRTTATDGTSVAKMRSAIGKLKDCGLAPWDIKTGRRDVAAGLLWLALSRGRPAVLVVDCDAHWIAVIGHNGDRILVADSAKNELVESLDGEAFMRRWDCSGRHAFLGVVL